LITGNWINHIGTTILTQFSPDPITHLHHHELSLIFQASKMEYGKQKRIASTAAFGDTSYFPTPSPVRKVNHRKKYFSDVVKINEKLLSVKKSIKAVTITEV